MARLIFIRTLIIPPTVLCRTNRAHTSPTDDVVIIIVYLPNNTALSAAERFSFSANINRRASSHTPADRQSTTARTITATISGHNIISLL